VSYSTIDVNVDPRGCARIVLNRPERLNAFNDTMLQELGTCVGELNGNPTIKITAIVGAGGNFCSGRDLSELPDVAARDSSRALPPAGGHESSMFRDLEMPTVALLDGVVVGGGLGFALQCDLRLATSRARFLDGHLNHGMSPSVAAWYLPRLTTPGRALRFVAESSPIDATEAHSIGLVDAVVEPDALEREFDRMVNVFLGADAGLLRHTKALLQSADIESYEQIMTRVGLLRALEKRTS
jgi:methylglutaconyl-CoA hydratase